MQTGICIVKDLSGRYIPLIFKDNMEMANIFMYVNRNNLSIECILEVGDYIKLHVNKDNKGKVEDIDYV